MFENEIDIDEFDKIYQPDNPGESRILLNLQNQVRLLTSQVRILKKMYVKNLFSSKREMMEFFEDAWDT